MNNNHNWTLNDNDEVITNVIKKDTSLYYYYISLSSLFVLNASMNRRVTRFLEYLNKCEIDNLFKVPEMIEHLKGNCDNQIQSQENEKEKLSRLLPKKFADKYADVINEIFKIRNSSTYLSFPIDMLVVFNERAPVKHFATITQATGCSSDFIKIKIDGKYKATQRPWLNSNVSSPAIFYLISIGILKVDDKLNRNVSLTFFGEQLAAAIEYSILHPEKIESILKLFNESMDIFLQSLPTVFSILRPLYKRPHNLVEINNILAGAGETNTMYVDEHMAYTCCKKNNSVKPEILDTAKMFGCDIERYLTMLEDTNYITSFVEDVEYEHFGEIFSTPITKYKLTDKGVYTYEHRDQYTQIVSYVFNNSQSDLTVEKYIARKKCEIINLLVNRKLSIIKIQDELAGLGYYCLKSDCLDMVKDLLAEGYNIKADMYDKDTGDVNEFDIFEYLFDANFDYSKVDYKNIWFWLENTRIDDVYIDHYALPEPPSISHKQVLTSQLMKTDHLFVQIQRYESKANSYKSFRNVYMANLKYTVNHGLQLCKIKADCFCGTEDTFVYTVFLKWGGIFDIAYYFKHAVDFDIEEFDSRLERSKQEGNLDRLVRNHKLANDKRPFIVIVTKYANEYFEEVVPLLEKKYHAATFAITYEALLIHMEKYRNMKILRSSLFHKEIRNNGNND